MTAAAVLLATTGILAAGGVVESLAHRRRLEQIGTRVHVNGTRGKSSVARLIAAGMREGGLRTCCKTTGTLPRMILPDGTEYPVFRPSRANIIEQLRIVEATVEAEAEALVIECMALIPYLQWLCESRIVRATHAVITNAREDHLDVMGPTEVDVAKALAGMIPVKGKLFTAERDHLDVFQKVCDDRGHSTDCHYRGRCRAHPAARSLGVPLCRTCRKCRFGVTSLRRPRHQSRYGAGWHVGGAPRSRRDDCPRDGFLRPPGQLC